MLKTLLPLTLVLLLFTSGSLLAQDAPLDVDKIKADIAAKEGQIKSLEGDVATLAASIANLPGWTKGAAGVLGMNFSNFNQWLGAANPNTFASTIGFSGNGFANYNQEKYFWRNDGNLTVGYTKLNTNTDIALPDSLDKYSKTADAINISSLFGYKLTEKWAVSALGEYRSTVISNFNDPGYLDIGVGMTWTPITDLVVVIHPLNYNIVMSSGDLQYESSLGAKLVADYTKSLPKGIAWKSKLSAFISYADTQNLSNWTWINGFNFNIFKGLGVGFELGLRGNKQEGFNNFLAVPGTDPLLKIGDLPDTENPLQSYWLLGFTYNL